MKNEKQNQKQKRKEELKQIFLDNVPEIKKIILDILDSSSMADGILGMICVYHKFSDIFNLKSADDDLLMLEVFADLLSDITAMDQDDALATVHNLEDYLKPKHLSPINTP